jgi:hypothetical protein
VSDPFAGIQDEKPLNGFYARARLLDDAKRGFMPMRKRFVQRPAGSKVRASVLADLVTGRHERALDALLLLHALVPVLDDENPFLLATWARMLSTETTTWSTQTVSRAFDLLTEFALVDREPRGRRVLVRPLREDGSGEEWTHPGVGENVGKGYFTIPYDYWKSGLADRLAMPGKAMFLIMLAETTRNPTFSMAVERAPEWYGISERTAERGYKELRTQRTKTDQSLLLELRQVVAEPRSPTGLRAVWHRALEDPYSMTARAALQRATAAESRAASIAGVIAAPAKKRLKRPASQKAGRKAAEQGSA